MSPTGKWKDECELTKCPAWVDGVGYNKQPCKWFSWGTAGTSCYIKQLAFLASKNPPLPIIHVASIDLDEFAVKAKAYRERLKVKEWMQDCVP